MRAVNLARKRFANSRPVSRLTLLLWIVGIGLFAFNAWSYYGYFIGRGASSARLLSLEGEINAERDRLSRLEREVQSFDLAQQNETTIFLNSKIAERAFSWSELFDRLAEVLPGEVRLLSLSPGSEDTDKPGQQLRSADDAVKLTIRGAAKSSEAILAFVDALFEHEVFADPDLLRETRDAKTGTVSFDLEVAYLPAVARAQAAASHAGGQP
jgi:Tfp pilus assembly protein PilN